MTPLLANLFIGNSRFFEALRSFARQGPDRTTVVIVSLGLAVILASAYCGWRWAQRQSRRQDSRMLLKLLAEPIGLFGPHRRLLRRLGRAAGLEPAMALVSPQLLMHLIQRGEQAGVSLTRQQTLQVGQILDAVAAACQTSGNTERA